MGVLLTQTCSEGRKENDWFTDSTNEIEAEAGSGNMDVWREYFRQIRYWRFMGGIYCKVSEFTMYFHEKINISNIYPWFHRQGLSLVPD